MKLRNHIENSERSKTKREKLEKIFCGGQMTMAEEKSENSGSYKYVQSQIGIFIGIHSRKESEKKYFAKNVSKSEPFELIKIYFEIFSFVS